MTNSERSSVARAVAGRWTAAALALLALGCGRNDVTPPLTDESELFWSLELDHHAVTLSMTAPYDTLTVTATPSNFEGRPLSALGTPHYVSSDLKSVWVTPEGRLVAVAPTPSPVLVTATLTVGNLKHTDVVWVKVMAADPPPVLAELSIHPVPPDSAKVAVNWGCGLFPLVLKDTNGASLIGSGIPVAIHSSDTTVGSFTGSFFKDGEACFLGQRPGVVRVYASATVFGVTKADTVEYRIGWPVFGDFHLLPAPNGAPGNVFMEREIRLGVGAVVFWNTDALDSVAQVVIEDSVNVLSPYDRPNAMDFPPFTPPQVILLYCQYVAADCGSGGTMTLSPKSYLTGAIRVFPTPGTYRISDPVSGDRVRVVIIDER